MTLSTEAPLEAGPGRAPRQRLASGRRRRRRRGRRGRSWSVAGYDSHIAPEYRCRREAVRPGIDGPESLRQLRYHWIRAGGVGFNKARLDY